MKKKWYVLIIYIFFQLNLKAQEVQTTKIVEFAEYLTERKMFHEAIDFLLSQKLNEQSTTLVDSIQYLLGINYGLLNEYEKSINHFSAIVNTKNNLFVFSVFRIGLNYIKLNQYNTAVHYFRSIDFNHLDSNLINLKYFSLASCALLQRKLSNYFFLKDSLTTATDLLVEANKNLDVIARGMIKYKQKKPFLAAIMNAVLPGMGKLYIGQPGEAFGTFIPITTMALLSLEAYQKGGVKSLPFIGFTSIFSIFYVSNIWGGIRGANNTNKKFNKLSDEKIISNMQFPFDNILW